MTQDRLAKEVWDYEGLVVCHTVRIHSSRPTTRSFPRLGSVFKDHLVVDHGTVIRRHELTDQEWTLLAPLIPRAATGPPCVSDRQVVNGMVYKIRTGISWRDLPERYGPWKTASRAISPRRAPLQHRRSRAAR
ncbi:transposase [Streptomyces sp. SID8352]|nr:transposase [Streptomyces sp. SID8352]